MDMLKISTATAIVIASATAAQAGEIVHSGTLPSAPTDWSSTVMIDQFDTMGGVRELLEVSWWFSGTITGTAEVESLDPEPSMITAVMKLDLSATLAGHGLGVISPLLAESFEAAPFDGAIDFGGASGATFGPMTNSMSLDGEILSLSAFEGAGQVPLSFEALGAAWTTGSGNVVSSFSNVSAVEYEVVYRYATVPTPGGVGLAVITGMALARRRRR